MDRVFETTEQVYQEGEDRKYSKEKRSDKIPKKLLSKKLRLKLIKEAYRKLKKQKEEK
ncbi:MAG: hypothetical protein ACE5GU_15345 [Candidatus Scalinduaceae bacterium]